MAFLSQQHAVSLTEIRPFSKSDSKSIYVVDKI